jgi:GNAT superfamily N-acetyltransferase
VVINVRRWRGGKDPGRHRPAPSSVGRFEVYRSITWARALPPAAGVSAPAPCLPAPLLAKGVRGGKAGRVTFLIRDAGPGDMDVLRDVYRRSSLSNEGDRPDLLAHPDALEFTGAPADDRRMRIAVAGDGCITGFATSVLGADAIELEDLFVDPDRMRQGAGRALVEDAVAIARGERAGRIEVTANRHALAFYREVGFVLDGEVKTRFGSGSRMHRDVAP